MLIIVWFAFYRQKILHYMHAGLGDDDASTESFKELFGRMMQMKSNTFIT